MRLVFRRKIGVGPVPVQRWFEALSERYAGLIAEFGKLRDIGTTPGCSARSWRPGNKFDLALSGSRDVLGQIRDRNFFHGADVVDAEMFALLAHHQNACNEIVDKAEAPRLRAAALNFKAEPAGTQARRECLQAKRELRDHVFESHVRTVNVVRPKNKNALQKLSTEIDRHYFADQFTGAVGIPRVVRIGYNERRTFIGRNSWRRLIDLRARSQNQCSDVMFAAGFDDIDNPAHADIEHKFGRLVKELGTIDESQMMYLIHALHGARNGFGVTNIAGNQFDFLCNIVQTAPGTTRVVVEYPHSVTERKEPLGQSGTNIARATGHQHATSAHACISPSIETSIAAPCRCERSAAAINCCTRYPSRKLGRVGRPDSIASIKRLAKRETGAMRPSGYCASSLSSTSMRAIAAAGRFA